MNFFRKKKPSQLSFEEIFMDASNLPSFNIGRMEGKMELPLSARSLYAVGIIFTITVFVFGGQLFRLQVLAGEELSRKSEQNRLESNVIVAERGIVLDRRGERIAWNERDVTGQYDFPVRAYTDRRGIGQLIGYVSYPQKDSRGVYYQSAYEGKNGVEETFEHILRGLNGEILIEENVYGEVISEAAIKEPRSGDMITLSIDAELSEVMHDLIATTTVTNGFRSGAAVMMDIETGEIVAMASYPSYDPEVLSDGDDRALIATYTNDSRFPFLNKVIGGAYIPGSIVKPFVAYAALEERVIRPETIIVSNGSLVVPNVYNPDNPAVFNDWRAHGPVDMRRAIAFSSNVYFYTIGGGFGDQKGLGITKIEKYLRMFGLGEETGIALRGELAGVVPNPAWKQSIFKDDWRLGDTYLTAIGQFGFQVTPLQMARAYAAIANGGYLVTPHIILGDAGTKKDISLDETSLSVIREGMRQAVIENGGTARSLERKDVAIAAKSGTAELGADNAHVNSWIAGYFPYERPRYTFVLFMEYGPRSNTVGAGSVMGKVFNWMVTARPEYTNPEPS